ncbi:YoaK family protein [Gordonia sp. VNK21]|uniref:YoaK family protein n=1 Tax=Gordonia sp. VNK21 TaxID=3382483 RepID=UPI0038D41BC4
MKAIARREVGLAVGLSSVAGYLDAVGYLALGGWFVSFMSGNTTELATHLGDGMWGQVGFAAALLGSFFCGVVLGAVLVRFWDGRTTVLTATTALVAITALLSTLIDSDVPVLVGLPLAMGAMNATFLTAGEASIGLTYMTGALVKSGQRLVDRFQGGPPLLWMRHLSLWAALLLGGTIGATVYWRLGAPAAMWIAAALLACAAGGTAVSRRRRGVFGRPAARTALAEREIKVL